MILAGGRVLEVSEILEIGDKWGVGGNGGDCPVAGQTRGRQLGAAAPPEPCSPAWPPCCRAKLRPGECGTGGGKEQEGEWENQVG